MEMIDNFGTLPKSFLPDAVLTRAKIKEIQRAIFDQNLGTALEVVNEESEIDEERNVYHVRGENRKYFMTEDKDEEKNNSATEIRNPINDLLEFDENISVSEGRQEFTEELKKSGTDSPNNIAQANDEEKLFSCCESLFDSENIIPNQWERVNSSFAEICLNSPFIEWGILSDKKPVDSICREEVDSRLALEEGLNLRKHEQTIERFKISGADYRKDQENKSNLDENENYSYHQGNENFEDVQQLKELEEKENCKERLKKSKVEKTSTKPDVESEKALRILKDHNEQISSKPKVEVKPSKPKVQNTICKPETAVNKVQMRLEPKIEKIPIISEAEVERTLIKPEIEFDNTSVSEPEVETEKRK